MKASTYLREPRTDRRDGGTQIPRYEEDQGSPRSSGRKVVRQRSVYLFTMPPFPFSPPWFRPTAAIPSITKLAKRFETIVDVLNALPHVDVIASETFPHLVREEGNQSERRSEA